MCIRDSDWLFELYKDAVTETFLNQLIDGSFDKDMIIGCLLYTSFHIYQCFEVAREKNTIEKATSLEVHNFFMTGQSVDSLWHTDRGIYDNLIFRKQLKEVKEDLKNNCRAVSYTHLDVYKRQEYFRKGFENKAWNSLCPVLDTALIMVLLKDCGGLSNQRCIVCIR